MLNKELLVVGARKVYPYTHLVKVSISKLNNYKIIGYSSELMYDTSTITPIVLSISGYDCGVVELCSWQEHNHTCEWCAVDNYLPRSIRHRSIIWGRIYRVLG